MKLKSLIKLQHSIRKHYQFGQLYILKRRIMTMDSQSKAIMGIHTMDGRILHGLSSQTQTEVFQNRYGQNVIPIYRRLQKQVIMCLFENI